MFGLLNKYKKRYNNICQHQNIQDAHVHTMAHVHTQHCCYILFNLKEEQ